MVTTPLPRSNGSTSPGRISRFGGVGWSRMGLLRGGRLREARGQDAGQVGRAERPAEVAGAGGRVGDGAGDDVLGEPRSGPQVGAAGPFAVPVEEHGRG